MRHSPCHVGRIPRAFGNIPEAASGIAAQIVAGEAGEQLDKLRACHGRFRFKGRRRHAVDHTALVQIQNCVIGPAVFRYVRKGQRRRDRYRRDSFEILHQLQIELAQRRRTQRGLAGDKVAMVILPHGHYVPDAGAIGRMGIAVLFDKPGRAALRLADAGAVGRIQRRDGIHHAVVGRPGLVDVKAAGRRLIVVIAHFVGKRHE